MYFDGLFLSKAYNVSAYNVMTLEGDANLDFNFHASSRKSENFHFAVMALKSDVSFEEKLTQRIDMKT